MNTTLATYSNVALYSAMAVYTLTMIAYAVHLAAKVPETDVAGVAARQGVLVGAGAAGAEPGTTPGAATATPPTAPDRSRAASGIAGSLGLLGTLLLAASVVMRALSVHRWPLGNMFEFGCVASLFVMVVFHAWSTRRDLRWLGLFVVGPVLLVLGLASTIWYTAAAELLPSLQSYWLVIHVTVATISVALFFLGCVTTLLYLVQERAESHRARAGADVAVDGASAPGPTEAAGSHRVLARIPPARTLERLAYGMHVVAFPLWTFTVIAGAIWARQAWGSYWNWDPKEVWTFIIWVVYAAYLHARATSGWSRAQASWIAVAGFGCILVNYGIVNVFFVSQHSYSGL